MLSAIVSGYYPATTCIINLVSSYLVVFTIQFQGISADVSYAVILKDTVSDVIESYSRWLDYIANVTAVRLTFVWKRPIGVSERQSADVNILYVSSLDTSLESDELFQNRRNDF